MRDGLAVDVIEETLASNSPHISVASLVNLSSDELACAVEAVRWTSGWVVTATVRGPLAHSAVPG
jgi:hypothetical protein